MNSYAGPMIKLCVNNSCKNPVNINITDACWNEVKNIFNSTISTDKDEQDNIVTAAALIESDIYHSMAKQTPEDDEANDLYVSNSDINHYRNMKKYLAVLLDNYLVYRHLMRKTLTKTNWLGFKSHSLLLQSLTDSKLYILKIETKKLGETAVITDYKNPQTPKNPLQIDNTPNDEDFE